MAETITLYSTNCPKCSVLKRKLQAKSIPFEENFNVDEMIALGFKSAPVLMVGEELLDFTRAVAWVNSQEVPNEY